MSVALVTMDSAYGLRLGIGNHHHHHHRLHHRVHSPESHVAAHQDRQEERQQDNNTERPLRFSVANILRPDFGRDAILSTKAPKQPAAVTSHATTLPVPVPRHSPLPLPRDLSLSGSRLSPQSPQSSSFSAHRERDSFSSHCGLTSPLQRHGLSRSGSLESLASSRSSVTGSSVNGAPSLCSTSSSTLGGESLSGDSNSGSTSTSASSQSSTGNGQMYPAWIYCTRYSDRPSSGPRTRRVKRTPSAVKTTTTPEEKRPRTAFSAEQLARLKREFAENRYLTERRRQQLSRDLGLNEAQIKIWFQNKRAKIKKASGQKNPLALQLMAQGLYNHSTVPVDEDGEEIPPPNH